VFVVTQVAFSVALVVTSGLVLGSMRRIVGIQPGFQSRGMAMATMDLSLLGYTPERGTQFYMDLAGVYCETVSSPPVIPGNSFH
jgi:hypothetical protein